jgi:lipid A oxidase
MAAMRGRNAAPRRVRRCRLTFALSCASRIDGAAGVAQTRAMLFQRFVMRLCRPFAIAAVLVAAGTAPATAEFELSLYSGWQTVTDSDVEGRDPGGIGDFDFEADWEGRSGETPPYYGIRGTWWRPSNFGFGLEFTHAKVYGSRSTRDENGFDTLEFTDGLNIVTANVFRRFPDAGRAWTPYVGVGAGISVPYVEVETSGTSTFEYQLTGPAAQWVAGISYRLTPSWSVFSEYQGTYSRNNADLDGGGDLETDILTNAVNLGVSFNF